MSIRLAEKKDLPEILKIYEYARNFMRENGNPNQWGNNYPQKADLEMDIEKRQLYLCTEELNESKLTEHQETENAEHHAVGQENLYGVFAFIMGADPTYAHIEQGTWKSDAPYGTIHRIAGNGTRKGVFAECMEFCRKKCNHLRIDTHADNQIMQHCIEKSGFEKSGVICVEDGTPRIAYEYVNESV